MSDDIRVGDRFLVEVDVTPSNSPDSGWELAVAKGRSEPVPLPKAWLLAAKRLSRPIQVGDKVIHQQINAPAATVIAIHKDGAWIEFEDGTDGHYPLSCLSLDGEPSP